MRTKLKQEYKDWIVQTVSDAINRDAVDGVYCIELGSGYANISIEYSVNLCTKTIALQMVDVEYTPYSEWADNFISQEIETVIYNAVINPYGFQMDETQCFEYGDVRPKICSIA